MPRITKKQLEDEVRDTQRRLDIALEEITALTADKNALRKGLYTLFQVQGLKKGNKVRTNIIQRMQAYRQAVWNAMTAQ